MLTSTHASGNVTYGICAKAPHPKPMKQDARALSHNNGGHLSVFRQRGGVNWAVSDVRQPTDILIWEGRGGEWEGEGL